MLFLTEFELNENMSAKERADIANKLAGSGIFPPKGVKIVNWIGTPDARGILLLEAESAEDVFKAINLWRFAGDGFFKATRTTPALPIKDALGIQDEIVKALGLA